MEKRIFIIHGWNGSPMKDWIPWLWEELKDKRFVVKAPAMPDPTEPTIEGWTHFIKTFVGEPNEETFFVGHSIGCQAILRYMENLPEGVILGGVVLVAPWLHLNTAAYDNENDVVVAREWLETPIDWEKVKSHAKSFVTIFSDNDPYVPIADYKVFKEKLDAEVVIERDKGHFDESSGVTKLQRILSEIIKVTS